MSWFNRNLNPLSTRRKILLEIPLSELQQGVGLRSTVVVDWFPPLSEDQLLQNAIAQLNGKEAPHPNPNFIDIDIKFTSG